MGLKEKGKIKIEDLTLYEPVLHQIFKKINAQFVKDLPIFIVLTVLIIMMSGYVLTIGCNIKRSVTLKDNIKRLLVIILVEIIFKNY